VSESAAAAAAAVAAAALITQWDTKKHDAVLVGEDQGVVE
jgi:hypothetical protein